MKKLIALICAAAMFSGICTTVLAAYSWTAIMTDEFGVYEDFASDTKVLIRDRKEWTKSGTQGPYYQNGIMYMESVAGDGKDTSAKRNFTAITGTKVAIDFDLQVNEGGYFGFYTFQSDEKTSSRVQSTISNGKPLLQMQAGKDDGSAASAKYNLIEGMEYGAWYSISMIYDLDAQRVDYYIDNELKYSDVRYFNNLKLADIAHFQIYSQRNDTVGTKFSIKDLKIGALTDLLAMHYDSYNTAPTGLDNVKDNIVLPTEGKYGSSIVWSSSNESVISSDGVVNVANASGGENGETVTLTANYSLNAQTYSRSFDAKVYAVDEETVLFFDDFEADKKLSSETNKDANGVIEKMTVDGRSVMHLQKQQGNAGEVKINKDIAEHTQSKIISEIEFKSEAQGANLMFVQELSTGRSLGRLQQNGTNLIWRGAKDVLLTNELDNNWHNVKVLTDTNENTVCLYLDNVLVENDIGIMSNATGNPLLGYVTLFDGAQPMHYGDLYIDYVKIYVPKNQEIAELVAGSIALPESTRGDVELPAVGSWGAQISWESYDEDYILSDGTIVSKPMVGESAYTAELEATVEYGMGSSWVSHFIDILPAEEIEYSYSVTDENGAAVTTLDGVEKVSLTLNMNINTDETLNMFISAAVYDETGTLIAVSADSSTLRGAGNVMTSTLDLNGAAGAKYVKCYIWEQQKPYVTIAAIE